MDTIGIFDNFCHIRIAEFLACEHPGVRYWDYLQRRKDSIVRTMGLKPANFTAEFF